MWRSVCIYSAATFPCRFTHVGLGIHHRRMSQLAPDGRVFQRLQPSSLYHQKLSLLSLSPQCRLISDDLSHLENCRRRLLPGKRTSIGDVSMVAAHVGTFVWFHIQSTWYLTTESWNPAIIGVASYGALGHVPPSTSSCFIFQVTPEPHKLWHSTPYGCLSTKKYSGI